MGVNCDIFRLAVLSVGSAVMIGYGGTFQPLRMR